MDIGRMSVLILTQYYILRDFDEYQWIWAGSITMIVDKLSQK
jgi:hypothetical protein